MTLLGNKLRGTVSSRAVSRAAAACFGVAAAWSASPALAQFACTTTSTLVSCANDGAATSDFVEQVTGVGQSLLIVNSGSASGEVVPISNDGAATLTNSGTIGGQVYVSGDTGATLTNTGTIDGSAVVQIDGGEGTLTNSGSIGGYAVAVASDGNVTVANSGTVGSYVLAETQGNDDNAAVTNSGSIGGYAVAVASDGNVTVANSGTVGSYVLAETQGYDYNAAVTNSGVIDGNVVSIAETGNATLTNSGTVGGYAFIETNTGAATLTNSGTIAGYALVDTNTGAATLGNSGKIAGYALVYAVAGAATLANSGVITSYAVVSAGAGQATVTNSGTIDGQVTLNSSEGSSLANSGVIDGGTGTAIQFSGGADALTLEPGSTIIGAINLVGSGDTINVDAGNQNLTFNTLSGATIRGDAPYVVSGDRIASVDPTGFAVADRNLLAFVDAAAMLDGQTPGAGAPASQSAHFADGFGVWANGFAGQSVTGTDGAILHSVTNFYGGAIGVDRQIQPDLKIGGFAGGGAISTDIALNEGSTASDIGFAGLYGRKDFGNAFFDFDLVGGGAGNRTTRNINNNLAASGLETAKGNFGGWFISPEAAVGARYDIGSGVALTPAARLRYLAADYEGYTESGSTSNLTLGDRTTQAFEERAELTVTDTQAFAAGRFQLGLTLGVLGQERADGDISGSLLGQSLSFAAPGKSTVGGGYGGAQLEWTTAGGLKLFAAAEYTATTDGGAIVAGKAGLGFRF